MADICDYCGDTMEGGELVLPWEDGNSEAYVICPHCGRKTTVYGYDEDDD